MNDRRTSFSSFQWILLGMLAGLLVTLRIVLHLPVKIPGHSGVYWMAVLVTATAIVPRRGAATATTALAGIMAVFAGVGDHGALTTMLAFLAAGIGVDVARAATASRENALAFAFAGLLGNLAKLSVKIGLEMLAGIPAGLLLLGRSYAIATHIVFGLLGGLLGLVIVRALRRAGYFAYLAGRQ